MGMLIVTERVAERLVTMDEAIDVVEDAFARLYRGEAEVFPVVAGRGDRADTFFGVKSGVIDPAALVGFKIGTYWPANRLLSLAAHASTTFLLDSETGRLRALLASSYLTCVRTAAADGVGIRHLSRPESTTVGMVGAGHQAWFELKAACEVRPIKRVLVWNRTPIAGETFARRVREELHIEASTANLRSAVEEADIVITSTASREPLVSREWVRPGTHISAMGSDAVGKGELSPALIRLGRLFCDVVDQSITLGDFESAFLAGLIDRNGIVPLGAVITGDNPGRTSEADITIFDSSGTALQDLAIGGLVLSKAVAQGLAEQIDTVGEEEASTAERVH
jgi:alanine dehydrogenase